MALGAFIAGRYSATYQVPAGSAVDVGITDQGWEIEVTAAKQMISETDAHGEQAVDAIFRGFSNVSLQGNALEWNASILKAVFPYGAAVPATSTGYLGPGVIGRLDSAIAGAVVLSAVASTPAAAAPATLTATLCAIAEGFPVKMLFSSRLRTLPGRWRIYPYDSSGTIKYFSMT